MNVERHMKAHRELYDHLAKGEHEKAQVTKAFYDEYFAVLDLTEEFYLETVRLVFQDCALPAGKLEWRGQRVEPRAIKRTMLLTVEGGARRHLCRWPDRGRARSVHRTAPLSQASPHAGRGRTLRRVQRQSLDQPNLPAAQERHSRRRVSVSPLVMSVGFAERDVMECPRPRVLILLGPER